MVEELILKMKFDQDLCLNLWYDLKKLLLQDELNPRVRCAFGNVSFTMYIITDLFKRQNHFDYYFFLPNINVPAYALVSWYLIHYTFRKNQIAQETTFARGTNFHFCPHRWTALLPVVENRDTVYCTPSQSVPSHICRAAFPECLCQICATQIHCWIDTCHDKGVQFISTLPLDAPVLSCCAQCAHCAVWVPSIRTSWDIS